MTDTTTCASMVLQITGNEASSHTHIHTHTSSLGILMLLLELGSSWGGDAPGGLGFSPPSGRFLPPALAADVGEGFLCHGFPLVLVCCCCCCDCVLLCGGWAPLLGVFDVGEFPLELLFLGEVGTFCESPEPVVLFFELGCCPTTFSTVILLLLLALVLTEGLEKLSTALKLSVLTSAMLQFKKTFLPTIN